MLTLSGKYVGTNITRPTLGNDRKWGKRSPHHHFWLLSSWLAWFSVLTLISLFSLLLVDFLDGSQLLLEFHSPVLEPDLDLSLSQTQGVSNLNATSASQVVVEVELLLQLQSLEPGVRLAASSPGTAVRTFDN